MCSITAEKKYRVKEDATKSHQFTNSYNRLYYTITCASLCSGYGAHFKIYVEQQPKDGREIKSEINKSTVRKKRNTHYGTGLN